MSRKTVVIAAVLSSLVFAVAAFAGLGPPGGTIYAHDVAYRTIGTPADLPPVGKFDHIYVLGGELANVSDAAPGDKEFNGGRWEVLPVTWLTIPPTQFTNAEQIHMAAQKGQIQIGAPVRHFECPLIPMKGGRR